MENPTESLEAQIRAVLEKYRTQTFETAERHMQQAFTDIAKAISREGLHNLPRKAIGGLSTNTLREIHRLHLNGKGLSTLDVARQRELLLEYLKARSLTFESIRIKYPNYLKPWKKDDDDTLELMWCQGEPTDKIARHLKRNPGAIEMRIEKLRLEDKYKKQE